MIDTLFIEFVGSINDFDKIILPHLYNISFSLPDWYEEDVNAHFIFNGLKKSLRINQGENIFYMDL